jgi:hypothetical protein
MAVPALPCNHLHVDEAAAWPAAHPRSCESHSTMASSSGNATVTPTQRTVRRVLLQGYDVLYCVSVTAFRGALAEGHGHLVGTNDERFPFSAAFLVTWSTLISIDALPSVRHQAVRSRISPPVVQRAASGQAICIAVSTPLADRRRCLDPRAQRRIVERARAGRSPCGTTARWLLWCPCVARRQRLTLAVPPSSSNGGTSAGAGRRRSGGSSASTCRAGGRAVGDLRLHSTCCPAQRSHAAVGDVTR